MEIRQHADLLLFLPITKSECCKARVLYLPLIAFIFCRCNLVALRVSRQAFLFVSSNARGRWDHLVSGESKLFNKVSEKISFSKGEPRLKSKQELVTAHVSSPRFASVGTSILWLCSRLNHIMNTGRNWLTWCTCRAGAGTSFWFSKGTGPASEGATDVSDSYIPEFSDDDVEESNASSSSGTSSYSVPIPSSRSMEFSQKKIKNNFNCQWAESYGIVYVDQIPSVLLTTFFTTFSQLSIDRINILL